MDGKQVQCWQLINLPGQSIDIFLMRKPSNLVNAASFQLQAAPVRHKLRHEVQLKFHHLPGSQPDRERHPCCHDFVATDQWPF